MLGEVVVLLAVKRRRRVLIRRRRIGLWIGEEEEEEISPTKGGGRQMCEATGAASINFLYRPNDAKLKSPPSCGGILLLLLLLLLLLSSRSTTHHLFLCPVPRTYITCTNGHVRVPARLLPRMHNGRTRTALPLRQTCEHTSTMSLTLRL